MALFGVGVASTGCRRPSSYPKTEMICPHCNHTIREEERYLMSRDPEAEWPAWGKYALYVLLFLVMVGLFSLHVHA